MVNLLYALRPLVALLRPAPLRDREAVRRRTTPNRAAIRGISRRVLALNFVIFSFLLIIYLNPVIATEQIMNEFG